MADISQEINNFQNAIYGEEVRGSMISLAEKLNSEVESNTTNVNNAVETAEQAVESANQAIQEAETTLQSAQQSAESAGNSANAAATSAGEAESSATAAAGSATSAENSAAAAEESAAQAAQVVGFDGTAQTVKAEDVAGLLGVAGAESNVQALINYIADQVLNQLVKKSQIINNLLATQAGNVLDATQGKALDDKITQLNSDMNNRNDVSDLLAEADVGINSKRIVCCGESTLNTPYKDGLVSGSQGVAYINMANESYGTVMYIVCGGNEVFLKRKSGGTWDNNWQKLVTNADFATGTARIQTTNGEVSTSQISFGKTFSSTPKVFCNIKTSVPSNKWVNAGNISTTGFTIYADVDVTGTIAVDWFAVAI